MGRQIEDEKAYRVEDARRGVLRALMALQLSPVEESIMRTLVYAGREMPRAPKRRSMPSLIERAGKLGGRDNYEPNQLPHNRLFTQAYEGLTARGIVARYRAKRHGRADGPGTPYMGSIVLSPTDEGGAASLRAYRVIRTLAIHVSPLGPVLEQALCRAWWLAHKCSSRQAWVVSGTKQEWAQRLGCGVQTAEKRLETLAGADMGVELEIESEGRAKSLKLVLVPPPAHRLAMPAGAKRHREEERRLERLRQDMESEGAQPERSPEIEQSEQRERLPEAEVSESTSSAPIEARPGPGASQEEAERYASKHGLRLSWVSLGDGLRPDFSVPEENFPFPVMGSPAKPPPPPSTEPSETAVPPAGDSLPKRPAPPARAGKKARGAIVGTQLSMLDGSPEPVPGDAPEESAPAPAGGAPPLAADEAPSRESCRTLAEYGVVLVEEGDGRILPTDLVVEDAPEPDPPSVAASRKARCAPASDAPSKVAA